jgi:hypothetical protein
VKEEKLHLTVGMKGKKLYIVVCSIKVPRMRMHIDEQHRQVVVLGKFCDHICSCWKQMYTDCIYLQPPTVNNSS